MVTARQSVGFVSFVVGAAILTGVNHHPGPDPRLVRDRAALQVAADYLTHDQIADAWSQASLGATAALTGIADAVDLRYVTGHEEGEAIILTFAAHEARCLDLVSTPDANAVETRHC
jgi:hypothetical protein